MSSTNASLDTKCEFIEAKTTVTHSVVGAAKAKPLEKYHDSIGVDLTSHVATESHLRRMWISKN